MRSLENNIVEVELRRALGAAGCGIVRPPGYVEPRSRTEIPRYDPHLGQPPQLIQLLNEVNIRTGISMMELKSPRRFAKVVRARMIFYMLAKTTTPRSLHQIAKVVDRDHSTVLHGIQCVERDRARFEPELSQLIEACGGEAP